MRRLEEIEIHREPGRHLSFPCLRRMADGRIGLSYREASSHLHPDARILFRVSEDEGQTWGEAHCAVDPPRADSRDGCFEALSNGRLMMAAFIAPVDRPYTEAEAAAWSRNARDVIAAKMWHPQPGFQHLLWSDDWGETWTDGGVADDRGACTRDGPRELRDGRIAMPVWCFHKRPEFGPTHCEVLVSADDGRSWETLSVSAKLPDRALTEPCFCELSDGRWISLMRTARWADRAGVIAQVESEDQGRSWSRPRELNAWGFPQTLLEHSSGTLYAFFGHRREPFGVRGMRSVDGGRTWITEEIFAVAEDGVHRDLGYPSAVELEGGRVLVVYYMNDDRDPFPYIRGTMMAP